VDFETVADELYGLAPEDFTATRNERAKQARSDGDRDVAERIRRLARPTAAAWRVNQLVRERSDEIQPLLELGAGLREATAKLSGDDLRRLGQQQHELVYALVRQARGIANAMGHKASDDTARGVEETLRAALADEQAAQKLAAGRLTDVLTHVGFSAGLAAVSAAGDTKPHAPVEHAKGSKVDQDAERLERARQDVAAAQQALDDACRDRDRAADALNEMNDRAQELDERLQRLHDELAAVERQQSDLERDRRRLDRDHDEADRAVRDAQRRLRDAKARQERLSAASR
jgi:hypothetical protein